MDEILPTQKVSAINSEAPEFLGSDYDANDLNFFDKITLEETKENIDWYKRAFESEEKNSYGIEYLNDMTRMHNNEVKNIAEYNLLHDIIIPPNALKFKYPLLTHSTWVY